MRGWRRYFVQASCSSSSGAFCARSGLEGAGCASGTWHREEPSFCSGRAARGGWGAFYSSPRLLSIDADAQESRRTPQSVLNLSDAAIARLRELQKARGAQRACRPGCEADAAAVAATDFHPARLSCRARTRCCAFLSKPGGAAVSNITSRGLRRPSEASIRRCSMASTAGNLAGKKEPCSPPRELDPSDMRMEQDGAKVAVDAVSMEFLRGATVDFQVPPCAHCPCLFACTCCLVECH